MNALKIRLQMFYYRHKKVTDFKPHVKKSKRSFWGNVIFGLVSDCACLPVFLSGTLYDQPVIKADE